MSPTSTHQHQHRFSSLPVAHRHAKPIQPRPIQTSFQYRSTQPTPSSSYAATSGTTNLPSFSALISSIAGTDSSVLGYHKSFGSDDNSVEVMDDVKRNASTTATDDEMGLSGLDLLGKAVEEMSKFDTRPKSIPLGDDDDEETDQLQDEEDKMEVDGNDAIAGQARRGSGCTSTSTSSASLNNPSLPHRHHTVSPPRSSKPSLTINTQLPPQPPLLAPAGVTVSPSSAPKSAAVRGVQNAMAAQLLGSRDRAGPYPRSYRRGGGAGWGAAIGGGGRTTGVAIRSVTQSQQPPAVSELPKIEVKREREPVVYNPGPGKPVHIGMDFDVTPGEDPMMRGLCVDELPLATPYVFEDLVAANRRRAAPPPAPAPPVRYISASPTRSWNPPRTLDARISEINYRALGVSSGSPVRISRHGPGRARRLSGARRLSSVPAPIRIPRMGGGLTEVERTARADKIEVHPVPPGTSTPTPTALTVATHKHNSIPSLYPPVQMQVEEAEPSPLQEIHDRRKKSKHSSSSISESSTSTSAAANRHSTSKIQVSPSKQSRINKTFSIPLSQVKWILATSPTKSPLTQAFPSRPSARRIEHRRMPQEFDSAKGKVADVDMAPGARTVGTGGSRRNVVAYRSPSVLPLPVPADGVRASERGGISPRRGNGSGSSSFGEGSNGRQPDSEGSNDRQPFIHQGVPGRRPHGLAIQTSKAARGHSGKMARDLTGTIKLGAYSPTERTTLMVNRENHNVSESPSPVKAWAVLAEEGDSEKTQGGGNLMTALSDGSDGGKKRKEWDEQVMEAEERAAKRSRRA